MSTATCPFEALSDVLLNDVIWNAEGVEGVCDDGEIEAGNVRMAVLRTKFRAMPAKQQHAVLAYAAKAAAYQAGHVNPKHLVYCTKESGDGWHHVIIEDLLQSVYRSNFKTMDFQAVSKYADEVRKYLARGMGPEGSAKWTKLTAQQVTNMNALRETYCA